MQWSLSAASRTRVRQRETIPSDPEQKVSDAGLGAMAQVSIFITTRIPQKPQRCIPSPKPIHSTPVPCGDSTEKLACLVHSSVASLAGRTLRFSCWMQQPGSKNNTSPSNSIGSMTGPRLNGRFGEVDPANASGDR